MQKQEFTYKDATHYLSCAHQINPRNRNEYHMPCIILKELPNNKAKILVFGDRRIKIELSGHKKRVRYVSKDRLSVIPQTKSLRDFPNGEHNISLKESSNEDSQISSNDETSLNNNIMFNKREGLK